MSKPLTWKWASAFERWAAVPDGTYRLLKLFDCEYGWYFCGDKETPMQYTDSLSAAKLAAEAHYEQRMRDGLIEVTNHESEV